jgi:hypothetical protein
MDHRKANYDRACVGCAFHQTSGAFHRCGVAKDLVSGKPYVTDCRSARSVRGLCGPDGSRWSPAEVVTNVQPMRKPGKAA